MWKEYRTYTSTPPTEVARRALHLTARRCIAAGSHALPGTRGNTRARCLAAKSMGSPSCTRAYGTSPTLDGCAEMYILTMTKGTHRAPLQTPAHPLPLVPECLLPIPLMWHSPPQGTWICDADTLRQRQRDISCGKRIGGRPGGAGRGVYCWQTGMGGGFVKCGWNFWCEVVWGGR